MFQTNGREGLFYFSPIRIYNVGRNNIGNMIDNFIKSSG